MLTLCTLQNAGERKHASYREEAQLEGREVNKQVIITLHTGALFTGLGLFLPPGTCASALSPGPWTLANSLWQDLAENCDFFFSRAET